MHRAASSRRRVKAVPGTSADRKTSALVERAPAKINLSLRVLGRRPDGYHELSSLVVFAQDVADVVTLRPGPPGPTVVSGPMGDHLTGANIVDRAVKLLAADEPDLNLGAFEILKTIPVAAGLGGGSADAAAALRAIADHNGIDDVEGRFVRMAATLGADVPVCLGGGRGTAAMMSGLGEIVRRPGRGRSLLPQALYVVLVNPRRAVATGDVFRELSAGAVRAVSLAVSSGAVEPFRTLVDLRAFLAREGNDLEAPARRIEPSIGTVLDLIARQPDCLLSRMSGSGATCFGLFADRAGADGAARSISAVRPDWWVQASRIG